VAARSKGDSTPRKLATATQLQFPRKIADLKQATGFQISGLTVKKNWQPQRNCSFREKSPISSRNWFPN
jgi:hypothetical protein